MNKIKIAIVDNEIGLTKILKTVLEKHPEIKICFTAENGKDALIKIESEIPDVILMDIQMPKMNGIEATRIISKKFPSIKVIMLTVMDSENIIFDSIIAGAHGYLTKDSPFEKISQAILECIDGGAPMSPGIAFKAMQLIKQKSPHKTDSGIYEEFGLSKRESEILQQIANGKTYKQIGDFLFISPSTVRKHIENIYFKLRVHNKTEALNKFSKNKS